MDVSHSQEIQELSRVCPRLTRKLSTEEARTLARFIDQRADAKHVDLLHKMTYLELSRDHAQHQYNQVMVEMQREVQKDKTAAEEYRRGFESLSTVLANKEGRFEKKYQAALNELTSLEQSLSKLDTARVCLEEDSISKDSLISSLRKDVEELNKYKEETADYVDVLRENSILNQRILRLKLDLDAERRFKESEDFGRIVDKRNMTLNSGRNVKYWSVNMKDGYDNNLDKSTESIKPKNHLSRVGTNAGLTFESAPRFDLASLYACNESKCRAAQDLISCRSQLVKQIEENTRLQQVMTNGTRNRPQEKETLHGLRKDLEDRQESISISRFSNHDERLPKFPKSVGHHDRSLDSILDSMTLGKKRGSFEFGHSTYSSRLPDCKHTPRFISTKKPSYRK